jgi:hypothetical protein
MTLERYYTMLLEEARKSHRMNIREARKWQYCLRETCLREARDDLKAAKRYISIIRSARNGECLSA